MTWRDLINRLEEIPKDRLDDEAVFLEPYDDKAAHKIGGARKAGRRIYASREEEKAGSEPIIKAGRYYLW